MGMFMHKHLNFFSRILVLFCVLATLVSTTPFAHAQLIGTATSEETDAILSGAGGGRGVINETSGERAAYLENQANAAAEDAAMGVVGSAGAGSGSLQTGTPDAQTQAAINNANGKNAEVDDTDSKIYNTAVWLGGFIASLGGGLFDGAIENVVLKMGCWFRGPDQGYFQGGCSDTIGARGAVGGVVNELWSVVRDLFNILFIFALVWIGLRMILFAEDSGTQRTLGMLIAAALLINFSLYFTKVIVDVSNYTAVAIHAVAVSGLEGQFGFQVGQLNSDGTVSGIDYDDNTAGGSDVGYRPEDVSLASAYMQALKISSWFSGAPITSTSEILVYSIILLLFSIILGFTLAFGALMLITRFIALVILMIFSPAMFLGWILPGFQKHASKWWSYFLGYAFFAPAYIFMLYLGLYTLIQLGNSMGSGTYAGALSGSWSTGMFTIFLFYALGIGFLIAATKVGQQMSVAGSGVAMATANGAMRRVRNGGASLGRNGMRAGWGWTGGRGLSSWRGGANQAAIDKIDAKDAERGHTTAFSRTRRASREAALNKKYGGPSSFKERKDVRKSADKKALAGQNTRQIQLDMASTDAATRETAFQNATPDQIVQIAKTADGRKVIMQNAHLLSTGKLDAITKSEDVGEEETKAIRTAHSDKTANHVINGTSTAAGKGIGKASNAELNAIGYEKLAKEENVVNLTPEKIDKLDLIDAYKDDLKLKRETTLLKIAQGTNVGGMSRDDLLNKKADYISKLPSAAFNEKTFVEKLPESVIKSKAFSELDVSVQRNIRTHLEQYINNPPQNISQSDLDRIAEIDGWFRSPGGKSFGK